MTEEDRTWELELDYEGNWGDIQIKQEGGCFQVITDFVHCNRSQLHIGEYDLLEIGHFFLKTYFKVKEESDNE